MCMIVFTKRAVFSDRVTGTVIRVYEAGETAVALNVGLFGYRIAEGGVHYTEARPVI